MDSYPVLCTLASQRPNQRLCDCRPPVWHQGRLPGAPSSQHGSHVRASLSNKQAMLSVAVPLIRTTLCHATKIDQPNPNFWQKDILYPF